MAEFLLSWNDTPTRKAIQDFVESVTDESGPDYVLPAERIAVFDNDGTLWCEKPMYIQLDYLLRRLAARAERDPSLRSKQPWQAAWEKDFTWLGAAVTKHYQGDDSDLHVLLGGILTLSEGQAVEQVEADAKHFVENERHPVLGLIYRDCAYQPMLELLRYLEDTLVNRLILPQCFYLDHLRHTQFNDGLSRCHGRIVAVNVFVVRQHRVDSHLPGRRLHQVDEPKR